MCIQDERWLEHVTAHQPREIDQDVLARRAAFARYLKRKEAAQKLPVLKEELICYIGWLLAVGLALTLLI